MMVARVVNCCEGSYYAINNERVVIAVAKTISNAHNDTLRDRDRDFAADVLAARYRLETPSEVLARISREVGLNW